MLPSGPREGRVAERGTRDRHGWWGSSQLKLDGRILAQAGWCEHPATSARPAVRREDLLIDVGDSDAEVHEAFWDNESHPIRYRDVHADPDGNGVRLGSDPSPPSPRQWLPYHFEEPDHLFAVFDLHGPGAPGLTPYSRRPSVRAVAEPS